jgi:catechol 2,3-dioxygenase-like lactoylglutathione lyase family enzyme
MGSVITKVDHAILFVRDLEAAAARYRRLGFSLTPRYTHPWGGFSNHNLIFQNDYVELLLPVEPTDRNLARFRELDRAGEGLKDISLAVPDSVMKLEYDNVYGCRQSFRDGSNRATHVMIGGKFA